MTNLPGSGSFGIVEQTDWFGQPSQVLTFPARELNVPGQSAHRYAAKY